VRGTTGNGRCGTGYKPAQARTEGFNPLTGFKIPVRGNKVFKDLKDLKDPFGVAKCYAGAKSRFLRLANPP
jgi:hypothetical protein